MIGQGDELLRLFLYGVVVAVVTPYIKTVQIHV